jgi:integrase
MHNVAALVDTPNGQPGRPSKALTAVQATAVLKAAEGSRLSAYLVLCLMTGIRTEEARALRWDHVNLDVASITGVAVGAPPLGGDTKDTLAISSASTPSSLKMIRMHDCSS